MTMIADIGEKLPAPRLRKAETVFIVSTRPLTREDILAFNAAPPKTPPVKPLQRIRDRHHAIARGFASGLSNVQISAIYGMAYNRVCVLRTDPSMEELIAFYRGQINQEFVDMHARMATLSSSAVEELQTRLEDNPEEFTVNDLREIGKTFADRTGHAPVAKSVSVNVNLGMASRLEEARRRAREASAAASANLVNDVAVEVA